MKYYPLFIYINRINNRLVFKIKDGYKLQLQTSETITLSGSTKKLDILLVCGHNIVQRGYISLHFIRILLEN